MSPSDICRYCAQPAGAHAESDAGPEWLGCLDGSGRAVTAIHFRPAGPTLTCERCGCVTVLPHAMARHLGAG